MKQRYLAVLFLTLALLSKVYADHEDIEDPQDHKHLEDPQTESEDAITSEPDTNCVDSMKHLCPGNLTWHNAAITENYCPMIKIKSNSNSYKSSGCFCCSPYVRDFSNNCILRCDCVTSTPPPVCVKPNEVYLTLPIDEKKCPHNGASMHTSTNKGAGCFCPKSFARDSRGNCIPECECSGSPDDIYGNCCGNLTWSNKFISESWCAEQLPPIAPSHRRPGCYCCAGYSRNKYGICVENCDCDPPNVITTMPPVSGTTKCPTIPITGTTQCPTTITITNKPTTHCKQTEIFLECGPFEKTCSNFKKELQTSNECRKAGCYCRDGYVRSRYGHCIKPQECATCTIIEKPQLPKDCFQNYTWLRKGAPEYFCDNRLVCDLDHLNSKACFCVNGFVLTDSGKCVRREDCTTITPPVTIKPPTYCKTHEVFLTCGISERLCNDSSTPFPIFACKVAGCYCPNEMFARDNFGNCILRENCRFISTTTCKPQIKCNINEYFSDCGKPDNYCNQPDQPYTAVCRKGCFCLKNYRRNQHNKCVPSSMCNNN